MWHLQNPFLHANKQISCCHVPFPIEEGSNGRVFFLFSFFSPFWQPVRHLMNRFSCTHETYRIIFLGHYSTCREVSILAPSRVRSPAFKKKIVYTMIWKTDNQFLPIFDQYKLKISLLWGSEWESKNANFLHFLNFLAVCYFYDGFILEWGTWKRNIDSTLWCKVSGVSFFHKMITLTRSLHLTQIKSVSHRFYFYSM